MAEKRKTSKVDEREYLKTDRIEEANIAEINQKGMTLYGANINLARVFPEIHDGLKPVERRILYTMFALMKLAKIERRKGKDVYHKEIVKVRTITGRVMEIHPHGDSSVYEALVRMAQPWNMLMPYIDGTGNFGTMAGDPAAADRYIECTLSDYAIDCFFSDWDPEVVLMEDTYNPKLREPVYLPTKYPNCLLSYSDGLGFGSATHIPTFNLEEVLQATISLIKDPKYEPNIIPDITTGCLIVDEGKFPDICKTGRGTFKMRSEIIKDDKRKCLIIKSVPFQVSLLATKLKIKDLIDTEVITGFKEMRDYSGEIVHMELYFRPEVDLDSIISILYNRTDMQKTYPVQIKMVDDFKPTDFSVKTALLRWINIRFQFKRKMFINELVHTEQRNHELEVLILVTDGKNSDTTIHIIKSSENKEEAIDRLVKKYGITSLQAKVIVNMRLSALTKDACKMYRNELKENQDRIVELKEIITSPKHINKIIIKELQEGIKKYTFPRRSKIIKAVKEYKYSDYDVFLVFTKNGYVKKLKSGTNIIGKLGETDEPIAILDTDNRSQIVLFDKRGSVHTMDVGAINQDDATTIGTPLSSYINIAGAPVSMFKRDDITDNTSFVFITKNGIIKKTLSENFAFKNSILSISLKPDDELVNVLAITEDHDVMVYTKRGVGLRFNTQEVPLTKRMAIGVIAMTLSSDDEIIGSKEIGKNDKYLVIVTKRGILKKCELDILTSKKRRSEPVTLLPLDTKDAIYTIVTCDSRKIITVITTRDRYDVRVNDLTSKLKYQPGDKLIPMKKGDVIATVFTN
jgi:DNA gyrase subunit A